jgi:hypothetical protein
MSREPSSTSFPVETSRGSSRGSVDVLAYVFMCAASKGLEILWEPWCIQGRMDVVELQNSTFARVVGAATSIHGDQIVYDFLSSTPQHATSSKSTSRFLLRLRVFPQDEERKSGLAHLPIPSRLVMRSCLLQLGLGELLCVQYDELQESRRAD